MPLYFSQTADKEPLELYGNSIMMTVVVMVMMIMILSLFWGNQVLM